MTNDRQPQNLSPRSVAILRAVEVDVAPPARPRLRPSHRPNDKCCSRSIARCRAFRSSRASAYRSDCDCWNGGPRCFPVADQAIYGARYGQEARTLSSRMARQSAGSPPFFGLRASCSHLPRLLPASPSVLEAMGVHWEQRLVESVESGVRPRSTTRSMAILAEISSRTRRADSPAPDRLLERSRAGAKLAATPRSRPTLLWSAAAQAEQSRHVSSPRPVSTS